MVDWVLDNGLPLDADLLFHVVPDTAMEEQFPGSSRTYTHLRDARICGADVHLVAHRVIQSHLLVLDCFLIIPIKSEGRC